MEDSQKRLVWWYAILIMLISTLPYYLGFLLSAATENKEGWVFTGFIMGVEDGNSYVAKSLNGSYGDWLFRSPYTYVPQSGLVAFFPYLLLGKLAAGVEIHTQIIALFHIFRIIAGILSIIAIAKFLSLFIEEKQIYFWSLVIATIGGGLGWILLVTNMFKITSLLPLEFYSPETFGFLNLFGLPHLSLARACMFWALIQYFQNLPAKHAPSIKTGILLGVLWLGMGLAQPITAVIFGFLVCFHTIILMVYQILIQKYKKDKLLTYWRNQILYLVVAGIIATPLLFYTFFKFRTDPFLINWNQQNLITSPHFGLYLMSLGLFWLIALPGIKTLLRKHNENGLFLVMWVIITPVLAYSPVNIQRRLTEGSWVALVCLGALGLRQILQQINQKSAKIILIGLATICLISTILIFSGSLTSVLNPSAPIYRNNLEIETYKFIQDIAKPDDLILTSYETGNAMPAWANIQVMIGHGPESVGLVEIEKEIDKFYSQDTSDEYRMEFIDQYAIRYIFWGPSERRLGGWNPVSAEYLIEVYQVDGYYIFETNPSNHFGLAE